MFAYGEHITFAAGENIIQSRSAALYITNQLC